MDPTRYINLVLRDKRHVSPSEQTLGTLFFKEDSWSWRLIEVAHPRPQGSTVQRAAFALAPGHVVPRRTTCAGQGA